MESSKLIAGTNLSTDNNLSVQSTEIIQNISPYHLYMELKTILLNQGLDMVCSEYNPLLIAVIRRE